VRTVRVVLRGWYVHIRHLTASSFFLMMVTVQPVVYASLTFFLLRAGDRRDTLLYAAVGAAMLAIWSVTLIGSGQALTQLRTAGMLELLVAAPTPFALVVAPLTLATASVGLFALACTLAWGRLFFGIAIAPAHPGLLVVALVVTVFGLGMLGLVLASVFVRFRYANAFTNVLDYPVWILSGMLVPVDVLPGWTRPVSLALPTTWGVRAIRESMLGGRPGFAIAMCLVLGVGYLGAGLVTVRAMEWSARQRASLALT
jgi:ABC-2 type transport system permease protein